MIALVVPLISFTIAGLILFYASRHSPPADPPRRVTVRTVTRTPSAPSRPRVYGYGKPRTRRKPQPYREDLDDYM